MTNSFVLSVADQILQHWGGGGHITLTCVNVDL